MTKAVKKFSIGLVLVMFIGLTSCEDSNQNLLEQTIQNKIALLESGEWLPKGFEDRVMHTFISGEQFTYYGENNVFPGEAIPGTFDYSMDGDQFKVDYHFGNVKSYDITFTCNNKIVEFYFNGELAKTLYKRNSNYQECL